MLLESVNMPYKPLDWQNICAEEPYLVFELLYGANICLSPWRWKMGYFWCLWLIINWKSTVKDRWGASTNWVYWWVTSWKECSSKNLAKKRANFRLLVLQSRRNAIFAFKLRKPIFESVQPRFNHKISYFNLPAKFSC